MLFRELSAVEENKFRQWAKTNDPPHLDRWTIYHPICRDEWIKRGIRPPFEGVGI